MTYSTKQRAVHIESAGTGNVGFETQSILDSTGSAISPKQAVAVLRSTAAGTPFAAPPATTARENRRHLPDLLFIVAFPYDACEA